MSGILVKLLRQQEATGAIVTDKAVLLESLMAKAEAIHQDNASFSAALKRQLAGNHTLTLSTHPDGLGCFYGWLQDDTGTEHRVDVLPPRDKWCGDMNGEAADAVNWIVYLNGEEAARAESIEALQPLTVG